MQNIADQKISVYRLYQMIIIVDQRTICSPLTN